ncbi:hypothetical protein [uncultured Sphingomonas sp.]|uniref:hypothetical protein n=1 Tax=uncultured Sphingomonas sp. TaxID=158754 RepID=UPI002628FE26|nr:hypothetical protein [uncultured Sphingomonas sp.]
MDALDIVRRDGEAEGHNLFTGEDAAVLQVEDDVRDSLGLRGAPAVRNEALMLVERPARRDTAAREELSCFGMKRVRGGVVAGVR